LKFGLEMFPTDYSIDAVSLGKAAEEHGFESLFFPEHTHIPTSRLSPWPGGAELPQEYSHTLDPFVALAAVAAVTKNLMLGTGICLVIERDPIVLAKEVASLDFLSGGRVLFGIGGGWNLEEMENHGTKPSIRWKILRERILAMKEIWTKDEAEYHGQYVNFDPIWSWPKPAAKPHPPIIVGGSGPRTLDRVLEWGDEWMPIGGRGSGALGEKIAELRSRAKAMGRGHIPVSIFGARADPAAIQELEEAGVDRCVFGLPPASADRVLPIVERYATVAQAYGD
jgi:probable F420-dependent oxidoreductase